MKQDKISKIKGRMVFDSRGIPTIEAEVVLQNQIKARAIGIFVANDITGGAKDLTPKEVLNLAKFIVKKIRKSHKNTPIFFIETTPTSKRWKVWDKISLANDLIKDFTSNQRNLFYINTRSFYIKSNGLPNDELFVRDKLHLNSKGYKLWGKIIRENLDEILNTKN